MRDEVSESVSSYSVGTVDEDGSGDGGFVFL